MNKQVFKKFNDLVKKSDEIKQLEILLSEEQSTLKKLTDDLSELFSKQLNSLEDGENVIVIEDYLVKFNYEKMFGNIYDLEFEHITVLRDNTTAKNKKDETNKENSKKQSQSGTENNK